VQILVADGGGRVATTSGKVHLTIQVDEGETALSLLDVLVVAGVALRGTGTRSLAGRDVCGAPGGADDVASPGLDRCLCPCWLRSLLIVCRLHLSVNCSNYLLHGRGSTGMDPQVSPSGGYCVGFGATWARLLG